MAKDRGSSPLFILVAMVTAIAALYVAKAILLPIALAILLCFLLTPLANRLERWRIPRIPAVLFVVLFAFSILGGLGWVVTNQFVELVKILPETETNLVKKIQAIRPESKVLANLTKTLTDLKNVIMHGEITGPEAEPEPNADHEVASDPTKTETNPPNNAAATEPTAKETLKGLTNSGATPKKNVSDEVVSVKVVEMPPSPFTQAQEWLGPLVAPLVTAGLVVILVLFMLVDRENQRNRLVQLFGRSHMHTTTEAIHDVAGRVGRYLRMLFLVNASYGLSIALGLWLIGVPGAIMWGVLGFALRFVPYLGPWIAATLPIMVSVATTDGWTQPILVVSWYIFIELVSNNIVEPMLYGNSVGISTVGVIISAIFWTWLWGPIGLILSMPMTVCLVVTSHYVPQLRFISVLLSDQPPMSPAERVYQRLLAFDYREPLKLAHKYLKESSLTTYYDEVLLPALVMAEHDRHADLLNDDQAAFLHEAAEDLVEELGQATAAASAKEQKDNKVPAAAGDVADDNVAPDVRVLCIPLRDEADEMTSRMLAQLLQVEGFQVESGTAESLTSEMVDRVTTSDIDIVVISILPPITARDSRLLWKRLRTRYPNLPIVVGCWTALNANEILAEPVEDSASKVVTKLSDAVAAVRSIAAHVKLAAKTA